MRNRGLAARLAQANPVDSERAAALALPGDRTALLEAVAAEPLPAGAASSSFLRQPGAAGRASDESVEG